MANHPPLTTRDTSLNLAYLGAGLVAITNFFVVWQREAWIFHAPSGDGTPALTAVLNLRPLLTESVIGWTALLGAMLLAAAMTFFAQWRARGLSPIHHDTVSASVTTSMRGILWALWAVSLCSSIWVGWHMMFFATVAQTLLLASGALTKVVPSYQKRTISYGLAYIAGISTVGTVAVTAAARFIPDAEDITGPGEHGASSGLVYGLNTEHLALAVFTPLLLFLLAVLGGALALAMSAAALARDPKQLRPWHMRVAATLTTIGVVALVAHTVPGAADSVWWLAGLSVVGYAAPPFFGGMLFLRWILRGGQCWHRRPIQVIQACGRSVLTLLVLATFVPPALALACRLAGYPTVDYRFSPLLLIVFTIPAIAWADWIHRTNRVAWCERGLAIVLNINDLRVPTTWVETGRITLRSGDTNGEPATKH